MQGAEGVGVMREDFPLFESSQPPSTRAQDGDALQGSGRRKEDKEGGGEGEGEGIVYPLVYPALWAAQHSPQLVDQVPEHIRGGDKRRAIVEHDCSSHC